jgi:hypothetical protein
MNHKALVQNGSHCTNIRGKAAALLMAASPVTAGCSRLTRDSSGGRWRCSQKVGQAHIIMRTRSSNSER